MDSERKWPDYLREIPALTWLFVIFGLLVLAGGFTAMAVLSGKTPVEPAAITALVTAVLGVVGTHVGHVTGNQQATKQGPGKSSSLMVLANRLRSGSVGGVLNPVCRVRRGGNCRIECLYRPIVVSARALSSAKGPAGPPRPSCSRRTWVPGIASSSFPQREVRTKPGSVPFQLSVSWWRPPARPTKSPQVRVPSAFPHKKPTDETALFGTRRHGCYHGPVSP